MKQGLISETQVVRNILELLRAIPDLKKSLPVDCEQASFWRKRLTEIAATRRILLLLREMLGFTERAPKRRTPAAW